MVICKSAFCGNHIYPILYISYYIGVNAIIATYVSNILATHTWFSLCINNVVLNVFELIVG